MSAQESRPADQFNAAMEYDQDSCLGPECRLAEGDHCGYHWVVSRHWARIWAAYCRVPPGHPWHGKNWLDLSSVQCHGGVTYSDGSLTGWWWVGCDAGHWYDLLDPELASPDPFMSMLATKLFKSISQMEELIVRRGIRPDPPGADQPPAVRDQAYMEAQAKSLCEQAAAIVISPEGEQP